MGARIGIDLGTTNSVCAYTKTGRDPRVLATRERMRMTPSVVGLHRDGTIIVGTAALRLGKTDPKNVVYSIKRLMGRRYSDPEVAGIQAHVPYRIAVDPDDPSGIARVLLGERLYSPIEISALILKKIKVDA